MLKIDNNFLKNLYRYLITGGTAFIIDYLLFLGVTIIFGDSSKAFANAVGLICGFIYTFVLNKYWSFDSKGYAGKQLLYNICLLCFNTIITSLLLYVWCDFLGLISIVGKIINTILTVCWNFFIYKYIIFK